MHPTEATAREIKTLRQRLSRLSQASLRINESLDLQTVLQGVLDSARSLTDARYGVIATLDDSGKVDGLIASGMSDQEAEKLWETTPGEHFCNISSPRRVKDFARYTRMLGIPDFRPPMEVSCFLAAPLRHQDECRGNIYLANKETGRAFTKEDEEILTMFASQAALVIANARRHRDEQRARADLETLIDISPVGVVVFDGGKDLPRSTNKEALRIFEYLRAPGQTVEALLKVLNIRREDGRETSLRTNPISNILRAGEAVSTEEVLLQGPDGREMTVLVNATPIRSEDGDLESFVVTVQDMAHLEDLERLRAEFLAMVSHELRTPLAAVKGAAVTVLGNSTDLSPAETIPFFRIINQQADRMTGLIHDLLDVARIETGTLLIHPEPESVGDLVDEARKVFSSGGNRHPLQIEMAPDLPRVMADRRRLVQVLGNLLGNAARHSPESTIIRIAAVWEGDHVAVSVGDQGRGVSAERLSHLFRKFSRRVEPDQDCGEEGRGLGLAICKGIVEAHGGRIWAESEGVGKGTLVSFTLPLAEEEGNALASDLPRTARRATTKRNRTPILVVDDDPQALRTIRDALRKSGYVPIVTADPKDVPHLMEKHHPHLVLLDLVLPGVDGIDLMKDLSETSNAPVIFLSAYGQDEVIARAFDAGAADYMVKPFSQTELAARMRATLRKRAASGITDPTEPYVLGELTIDYAGRCVTVAGQRVRLTDIEYRLLAELSVHPGWVVTHEQLLQTVWGPGSIDPRVVRAAVKNLRRKLGDDAANPTFLFTEPRVGYRLGEKTES